MAETKYGQYFINEPVVDGKFAPKIRFFPRNYSFEKNCSVQMSCITAPYLMEEHPHAHDFDQFLFFYGGNSLNIKDFGAEVEFSLGEEHEKHIITAATVVHVPAGMIHCPLFFKRVDKPVIFMNVALTPIYVRPAAMK